MAINKNLLFELSVFIAIVAVAGHLTTHCWDRYFLHHEISNMKSNLHMLKHTVRHIGAAYDDLHKELNELAKLEQRRSYLQNQNGRHERREKYERRGGYAQQAQHDRNSDLERDKHRQRRLDRRKQHEINVLAKLKEKETLQLQAEQKKEGPRTDFAQTINAKNATTVTKSCLKSTGVGISTKQYCVYKERCRCNKTRPNKHWKY